MATYSGVEFTHHDFPSQSLNDTDGDPHVFNFATRLLGAEVSIEAYEENVEPGYQFQVIGRARDVQNLFHKLIAKMQRAFTRKHLTTHEGRPAIEDDLAVRGRFDWDDDTNGELPLLVIDGKPITWEELGRLLSSYEGWQFKIDIFDRSEER